MAATIIAYLPAVRGGFIWDDDAHVTRPELRSLHGLYRIWFDVGATQQYYPLLHSAFWFEHKLWGDNVIGYHLLNIALHAGAAILIWRLVRRLLIAKNIAWAEDAALLTAAVFALHPVHVESVAWITEQKNTLSAVFYLAAMAAYLNFDQTRQRKWYKRATALFILCLLTKTVTATLPAALLVIFWWQRGKLSWKRDVIPLIPWFALGLIAGLLTAWIEHDLIGARGRAFELSAVQRFLLAGRVVWFYLSKLFWPSELIFIYPRWSVDPAAWRQWLFPAALAALFIGLLFLSRKNRAPLAAMLFFVGSLFPVLGFFNVFPFLYSFVADHFQYLASLGVIALVSCGVAAGLARVPVRGIRAMFLLALPAVLGALTYRQCQVYADVQTLYETTIQKNPACWMAYNNLGILYKGEKKYDQAIEHYRRTLQLNPRFSQGYNNLGVALNALGRCDEAIAEYQKALQLRPANPEVLGNLATALADAGRHREAVSRLQEALQYDPRNAGLHRNLGATYQAAGRFQDAASEYRQALQLEPDLPELQDQLKLVLAGAQPPADAIAAYQQLLRSNADNIQARFALAVALTRMGRTEDAIRHYQMILRIDPRHVEAHSNLATILARAGRRSEAITHFEEAVRLLPNRVELHMNLAVAYASANRFADAMGAAQHAREIAQSKGQEDAVGKIDAWIASCRARTSQPDR